MWSDRSRPADSLRRAVTPHFADSSGSRQAAAAERTCDGVSLRHLPFPSSPPAAPDRRERRLELIMTGPVSPSRPALARNRVISRHSGAAVHQRMISRSHSVVKPASARGDWRASCSFRTNHSRHHGGHRVSAVRSAATPQRQDNHHGAILFDLRMKSRGLGRSTVHLLRRAASPSTLNARVPPAAPTARTHTG